MLKSFLPFHIFRNKSKELFFSHYFASCIKYFLNVKLFKQCKQCFGSKYVEFGSGSWILAQFGSESDPGLCCKICKKNLKIILKKINVLKKSNFLTKKVMEEILFSWVSERWIYVFNLTPFAFIYPIFTVIYLSGSNLNRIRIHNTEYKWKDVFSAGKISHR